MLVLDWQQLFGDISPMAKTGKTSPPVAVGQLTEQQRKFVESLAAGAGIDAAAGQAGMAPGEAREALAIREVQTQLQMICNANYLALVPIAIQSQRFLLVDPETPPATRHRVASDIIARFASQVPAASDPAPGALDGLSEDQLRAIVDSSGPGE